jgi:hypothetical protein
MFDKLVAYKVSCYSLNVCVIQTIYLIKWRTRLNHSYRKQTSIHWYPNVTMRTQG